MRRIINAFMQGLRAYVLVEVCLGAVYVILSIVSFNGDRGPVWDRGRFVVGQI